MLELFIDWSLFVLATVTLSLVAAVGIGNFIAGGSR